MDAMAYFNRGYAKYLCSDFKGAIADYNKAIKLEPKFAIAYANRGTAKEYLGDIKGALADYEKAIQLDPSLRRTVQLWINEAKAKLK